jgi:hypothetical protein
MDGNMLRREATAASYVMLPPDMVSNGRVRKRF